LEGEFFLYDASLENPAVLEIKNSKHTKTVNKLRNKN